MTQHPFTILLSASVPTDKRDPKFTKIKNAQIQIEEAVIGLSRNIFNAGGKMVFGGHPSISPLVAMIATEFHLNKEIENTKRNEASEKKITIYQSKVYEALIPKETTGLYELGYSDIIWTDSKNGEVYNADANQTSQCPKSLEFMRRQMMSREIDALVCIGGMEGVQDEFALFRELHPRKPIFILKSTGGASSILAEQFKDLRNVSVPDDKDFSIIKTEKSKNEDSVKFNIIPYSFITALIVKEILDQKHN